MYLHPLHRFPDADALFALMAAHALGTWVFAAADGLHANHLPFLLDRSVGTHGVLLGHVARANPVLRALGDGAASVVSFLGPQAYATPGWYPGKAEHGRVVPTWNYAAVHAHGRARPIEDRTVLRAVLQRLTDTHEADRPVPWRMDDAPREHIEALLDAVVGIEVTIERLEGRLKASQDEAAADRAGTVQGLAQSPCDAARAMGRLVAQAAEAEGAPRG